MEKRKLNRITAGFIVLVVMVLILMFSNSLRRSSHITLPEEGSSPGQAEDTNASGGDAPDSDRGDAGDGADRH